MNVDFNSSYVGASLGGIERSQPSSVRALGLGDIVKNMTSAVGIPTCNACEQRAQALNNFGIAVGAAVVGLGLLILGKRAK
jgi:hypothetical protein